MRGFGVKHAEQSLVGVGDAARGVEREHSGGNALENGFHLAATAVEFGVGLGGVAAGGFDLAATGFELFRHAIEGADEIADFVGAADFDAVVETSAGNFLRGFGEGRERTRDQLREKQRQPGGDKQHDHGEQQQVSHVDAAHASAFAGEIVVALLAGFNLLQGLGKLGGERNGDDYDSGFSDGRGAESVVGVVPGELRHLAGGCVGEREL